MKNRKLSLLVVFVFLLMGCSGNDSKLASQMGLQDH